MIDLGALEADLDETLIMRPGGSKTPTRFSRPESDVAFARQILEAPSPLGSSTAFEVVARVEDREQRCLVVENEGLGGGPMACGPVADPLPRDADILTGAAGTGPGNSGEPPASMFALVGPADTTHFIVDSADRRIGLVAVEGIAVLATQTALCLAMPTSIEAWADDELLLTETPPEHDCP